MSLQQVNRIVELRFTRCCGTRIYSVISWVVIVRIHKMKKFLLHLTVIAKEKEKIMVG